MFKAILIEKNKNKQSVNITKLAKDSLPIENTLIDVEYSSLNYKDALAITETAPIIRNFPLIPGIDLAGQVISSGDPKFNKGDHVVLNGWGVGEKFFGGFSEKACVKSEWLTLLPDTLNTSDSMIIGTAGYTAMLSILALEKYGLTPEKGPILVTGATGGVGSFAVTLLNALGYEVVACTTKNDEEQYLRELGASSIIDTKELNNNNKLLNKEVWAGAIDCVGSRTLANVLASIKYGGVVAACGLAQGIDLPTSVTPFILRNIALVGIDSVLQPQATRYEAWQRLANIISKDHLKKIATFIKLEDVIEVSKKMVEGKIRGRFIIDIKSS